MTDYTNYAFFGIDSQTGSMSDRGNRSDSIIVVSINNSTKDVKLLSIYRDTYVSINGNTVRSTPLILGVVQSLRSARSIVILI